MFKRALCLVLVLAVFALGCEGDTEPDTNGDGTEGEPESDAGAAEGGTLVVGESGQLPAQGSLNPAVSTQGGMQRAAAMLFNGLVEIDENGEPVPSLATEWDVKDDGRVYVFTLRDDVVFHDGEPLTAEDVKWTYEAALLRNHARTQSSIGPALAEPCAQPPEEPDCPSIEAEEATGNSPGTITFRFAEPYGPLLQQLAHTEGAILPKHVWEGEEPPTAATPWPSGQEPIGTGPFQLASHDASEIVLERNEDYFGDDGPYLDRVVQRAIPTPPAQVQALQAGEVDWLWNVRGQDVPALDQDPEIELVRGSRSAGGATNCVMKVVPNLWEPGTDPSVVREGGAEPHPILGDVQVRRAIAHALQTDDYVEQVLQGEGRLASSPISSEMEWAHTDAPIPFYDPDEAEQLLDEVGWQSPGEGETRTKDGEQLVIDMYHFAGTEGDLGTKIAQDLARVGIDVELQEVDGAGKTALYGERDFDTIVVHNCQQTDPEIGMSRFYYSSAITGAPFTNGAGYRNQEVDDLLRQAAQELDQDKRGQLYAQAQEQLAEDLPYLWLLEPVAVRAHTSACEGFRAYTGHFAESARCEQ